MSPNAQHLVAVIGVLVWVVLAVLVAIAIGRSIKQADDEREAAAARAATPCCPHDVEQAPETVRGQFRAIVVPEPRGQHVDVKA